MEFLIYFGLIMFMELYKFSRLVMHLNSCSLDLGRDKMGLMDPGPWADGEQAQLVQRPIMNGYSKNPR